MKSKSKQAHRNSFLTKEKYILTNPLLIEFLFLFVFIFLFSTYVHYSTIKISLVSPKTPYSINTSNGSFGYFDPLERAGTTAVPIGDGSRALVFSGVRTHLSHRRGITHSENVFFDDILIFSIGSLSKLGEKSQFNTGIEHIKNVDMNSEIRPDPRAFHAIASSSHHVYIWGGATYYSSEDPVSRFRPSFSFPDEKLVHYGIENHDHLGIWELDTRMLKWRYISASNEGPKSRIGSFGFFRDQSFYIFGGMDISLQQYNDIWAFNITTRTWSRIQTENQLNQKPIPSPRYLPTAVYTSHHCQHEDNNDSDRLYVYNGLHGRPMYTPGSRWINLNHTHDFWTFDFETYQWQKYDLPRNHVSKAQGVMTLVYNPKTDQYELIHIGGDQETGAAMYTGIERPTNPSNEIWIIKLSSTETIWSRAESKFLWMNSFTNTEHPHNISSESWVQLSNSVKNFEKKIVPELNLPFGTSIRRHLHERENSVMIVGGGYTVRRDNERGEKIWNNSILMLSYV